MAPAVSSERAAAPSAGRPARRAALAGRRSLLVLLCVAQFVDVLDVNAVLVALPAIGRALGLTPGELQWVVTAYVLVFAGFLLLAGRLADLFGRRRLFMAGLLVFTLASLACGLARDPLALVAARAFQGLGAAITAPAALAIITTSFREGRERSAALAVWTAVAAGGGAAGLVLGGLITDALGWEWVFFVNVPIGLAALALSPLLLPESRAEGASRRVDVPGAVTATGALAVTVFAFSHAERAGPGSPVVLASLVAALLLAGAFLLAERRARAPLVPLAILRSRELAGSMLVAAALTATTSSASVLATLYLQDVLGYSPGLAGLAALPLSVSVIAGSAVGPRLMERAGPGGAMSLGLVSICCGALVASRISPDGGLGYVLAAGVLAGLGLGAASVAATACGTGSVDEGKRGLASGLLTSSAQVGTALGVAAFVWLASARTDSLASGRSTPAAVVGGYELAFLAAAALAAAAALTAPRYLRRRGRRHRSRRH
jgi:EmrB/QacA subfamily drug resistance transporter